MDARAEVASDLADAYRDLGQVRAALATSRANLWRQLAGMGVTERRDTVAHETADLYAEASKLECEIEALKVILGEMEIRHGA